MIKIGDVVKLKAGFRVDGILENKNGKFYEVKPIDSEGTGMALSYFVKEKYILWDGEKESNEEVSNNNESVCKDQTVN